MLRIKKQSMKKARGEARKYYGITSYDWHEAVFLFIIIIIIIRASFSEVSWSGSVHSVVGD
jgi:hypothetical protein